MNTSPFFGSGSGSINLIGQAGHRQYLNVLAVYGLAHRGGAAFPFPEKQHSRRLVSDINLLSARERRQLIFSASLFNN